MTMRAFALAVSLAPLAVAASGQRLDGAFGIPFGEPFSPDGAESVSELEDGGRLYRLDEPPRPYGVLQHYRVRTGAAGAVREIAATAALASAERCAQEQGVIADALVDKYGSSVARLTTGGDLLRRTELHVGPDRVEIVCVGEALELRYVSVASTATPSAERETSASDADASGGSSPDTSAL